jgi:hypothetical protein
MQMFKQLGITTWQLIRHWFNWNNLIMRYRFGKIDHENFRNELKKIFPVLTKIEDNKIDDAWNKMCEYNEHSTTGFKAIRELVASDHEIYVFSRTNPKHLEFITQKLHEADSSFDKLPGQCYWSFEGEGQKIANDFVGYFRKQIKSKNASAAIQLFYTHPVDPAPTWFLGWLQKPYEKYMFKAAEKHVKQLHQRATALGFELISCEQKNFASKLSGCQSTVEEKRPDVILSDSTPTLVFRGKEADKEKAKEGAESKVDQQSKLRTFRPRFCPLAAD